MKRALSSLRTIVSIPLAVVAISFFHKFVGAVFRTCMVVSFPMIQNG